MIESLLSYTKENVGEFVRYNIFGKSKTTKIYIICYIIFMIIIASAGAVTAIVTGMIWFLFATVISVLLIAGAAGILMIAVNKYTKEIFEINLKNGYDAIEITASSIVLKKNDAAKAIADWTAVASVDFNADNAYIVTHDGFLFIIGSKDIKEGSIDELKQIAEEKLVKADD